MEQAPVKEKIVNVEEISVVLEDGKEIKFDEALISYFNLAIGLASCLKETNDIEQNLEFVLNRFIGACMNLLLKKE